MLRGAETAARVFAAMLLLSLLVGGDLLRHSCDQLLLCIASNYPRDSSGTITSYRSVCAGGFPSVEAACC